MSIEGLDALHFDTALLRQTAFNTRRTAAN
jgi:hypothetical protein